MPRQKDVRQRAIAEAAMQLFLERGYSAVTAEDIAGRAGIGVRTFFRYFATKDAAAFLDHEDVIQGFRDGLASYAGKGDPVDALFSIGQGYLRRYLDEPDLYRARYRLIETEPALRDRQLLVDATYLNMVRDFMTQELAHLPNVEIVAATIASSWAFGYTAALGVWARDERVDPVALLAVTEATLRQVFRAAMEPVDSAPVDPQAGPATPPDLVVVLSADPELKARIREVVERRHSAATG